MALAEARERFPCRAGHTLVVTKLDGLALAAPTRDIVDDLPAARQTEADPIDPVGELLFNVLAMVAEIDADLIPRARARDEGRQRQGRLRGKQPNLTPRQEAHLVAMHRTSEHTTAEPGELSNVARSTVYGALERARQNAPTTDATA